MVIPFDIMNEDGYLGMTFMFLANTIKIFAFGWVVCAKGNFAIFMNDKVYQDYDYLTGKFGKIVLSGVIIGLLTLHPLVQHILSLLLKIYRHLSFFY